MIDVKKRGAYGEAGDKIEREWFLKKKNLSIETRGGPIRRKIGGRAQEPKIQKKKIKA